MAAPGQEKPPTRELGTDVGFGARVSFPGVFGGNVGGQQVEGWSSFAEDREHVPELRGHALYQVCDQMLTNPQVWALFMGMMLPLTEYDFALDPAGADEGMTATLAADLGLPVGLPAPGDKAPPLEPGQYRFNFLTHLWESVFAAAYGHYWFEQVGVIGDDGLWHLQRLDPRSPRDILDILTDDHGGLVAIIHPGVTRRIGNMPLIEEVAIPASQLIGYVWLPAGRKRWTGHSMLRACYEPWLLRDRLVRIDTINHQRAGGVPYVETDPSWEGADLSEMRDMASAFNVSEESGAALPPGAHLKLAKVGGTDVIASMRYHDESMARAWGAMVRQLGQTMTGSRALGMTFADLEAVVRRSIMRWFAGTFREHMIEDWWRWNVPLGPDGKLPPHPQLAWRDGQDPAVGNPTPGNPNVPEGGASPPNPPVARSARLAGRSGDAAPSGDSGVIAAALPNRPLRRQPYTHELHAAVDYAAMDVAYQANVADTETLLAAWLPGLIQAAEDSITFTKTGSVRQRLTRLNAAQLSIPAPDVADLAAILLTAAREGATQATAELASQGVAVDPFSDDELTALVADHAASVAQEVANGIQLAASRRAVQMNSGRTPGEVAVAVSDYLGGLEHRWERDQLAGAVQAATNAARLQVFATIPSEATESFYASELLDVATCGPCRENDGREYVSISDAQRDYSFGGFNGCLGGPRCRGTVVAVIHESGVAPGTDPLLGPGVS